MPRLLSNYAFEGDRNMLLHTYPHTLASIKYWREGWFLFGKVGLRL